MVGGLALLGLELHSQAFFAFFLAFLLGTYSRVNLARNTKGQIKLTKTWRAFFYELPTTQLKLSQYEGIATGQRVERLVLAGDEL